MRTKHFLLLFMLAFLMPLYTFAQGPINVSDPSTLLTDETVSWLTAFIVTVIAFLSNLIPGIAKFSGWAKAAAVVIITSIFIFINKGFGLSDLSWVIDNLMPYATLLFAKAGGVWETIKYVLKLFGVDLKGVMAENLAQ